jgi:hypothetical protein
VMNGFKKSYTIATETVAFTLSNLGTLKSHLIMIAPYFLVCSLALHFIVTYEKQFDLVWLKYAMLVPSTFIAFCTGAGRDNDSRSNRIFRCHDG